MTASEDIRDIFSILHDGTITTWTGDRILLTLTVECEYLAERIDKSFNSFYVELSNIDKMELAPWTSPIHLPTIIKTDFADIFKAELLILSADIIDGSVVVSCSQYNRDLDYCGGNLTISCQKIKVFDQNKNALTIGEFGEICKNYWDEWRTKT